VDDKSEGQKLPKLNLDELEEDPWAFGEKINAYIQQREVKKLPINSWGYVNQLRDEMIEDAESITSLEPAWELLEELYDGIFERFEDEPSFKLPVEEFIFHISNGFYPRPELLVAVASCFQSYFSKKGEIELEEVFFGKNRKRIGNHSARKSHHPDLILLENLLRQSKSPHSQKNGIKPLTLDEAAEKVINELKLDVDPESLLRKYRRYRKDGY
jgi:hypothetical protein|tara:strand:- start:337 stop:978 length:642 start_codon:yes stop_codon:yes gene_type:complete